MAARFPSITDEYSCECRFGLRRLAAVCRLQRSWTAPSGQLPESSHPAQSETTTIPAIPINSAIHPLKQGRPVLRRRRQVSPVRRVRYREGLPPRESPRIRQRPVAFAAARCDRVCPPSQNLCEDEPLYRRTAASACPGPCRRAQVGGRYATILFSCPRRAKLLAAGSISR